MCGDGAAGSARVSPSLPGDRQAFLGVRAAAVCHVPSTRVCPKVLEGDRCPACRHLVPTTKDDPRMARILDAFPKLDRWRNWKVAETPRRLCPGRDVRPAAIAGRARQTVARHPPCGWQHAIVRPMDPSDGRAARGVVGLEYRSENDVRCGRGRATADVYGLLAARRGRGVLSCRRRPPRA